MKFGFAALVLCCLTTLGFAAEKLVKNGKTPEGQAQTLKLTEDLRLGYNGDDNFLWAGSLVSVSVGPKGHMYVVDRQNSRVVELDPQGKFVRTIGRHGMGPGEFRALANFQVFPDGTARSVQHFGVTSLFGYYDTSGKFLKQDSVTGLDKIYQGLSFSPSGKYCWSALVSVSPGTKTMRIRSLIMDKDLKPFMEVRSVEDAAFDQARATDTDYWIDFLGGQFRKALAGEVAHICMDKNDNIYTAMGNSYEVTKWNEKQEKLLVFKREYKPYPIGDDQIEAIIEPIRESILSGNPQLGQIITANLVRRALEKAEIPLIQIPIHTMFPMEDKLLVINFRDVVKRTAIADIFDENGKYLGDFTMGDDALPRMSFQNGFAYTIETDENDENYLVRYKYEMAPATGG